MFEWWISFWIMMITFQLSGIRDRLGQIADNGNKEIEKVKGKNLWA